jgi:hypothetical protein
MSDQDKDRTSQEEQGSEGQDTSVDTTQTDDQDTTDDSDQIAAAKQLGAQRKASKGSNQPADKNELAQQMMDELQTRLDGVDTKYQAKMDALKQEHLEATKGSDWGQVAETVGQAMTRFGAAKAGLKAGVDLSRVDMPTTNWDAQRDRASKEYLTKLQDLLQQQRDEKKDLSYQTKAAITGMMKPASGQMTEYQAASLKQRADQFSKTSSQRDVTTQSKNIQDQINDNQKDIDQLTKLKLTGNATQDPMALTKLNISNEELKAAGTDWRHPIDSIANTFSGAKSELIRRKADEALKPLLQKRANLEAEKSKLGGQGSTVQPPSLPAQPGQSNNSPAEKKKQNVDIIGAINNITD